MIAHTDKMYFVLNIVNVHEVLQEKLLDCFTLIRLLQEPTCYQMNSGEENDYQLTEVLAILQNLQGDEEKMQRLVIETPDCEFVLSVFNYSVMFRCLVKNALFFENETLIEDFLTMEMKTRGSYAYIRAYDEYLYHNIEEISLRDFDSQVEIEELPKMYGNEKELLIDCSQLAGYDLIYQGLCFTSCYKMWFNQLFYQYIPQAVFLEIQQVSEIQLLQDGHRAIYICLYKDPLNWHHPANLYFQRLFRDQLGFDQFVYENGIGVLRAPRVEYTYSETGIKTVQYQNEYLQPVEKNKAKHFVLRNTHFHTYRTTTKRNFGILNSMAYFPWQDDVKKKMMNYYILDPSKTIDNGVKAYEFYIRQFLEINVEDEKYQTFIAVLRLYIPKKAFKTLSYSAIIQRFKDAKINILKQSDLSLNMDFKKNENHLRVLFLPSEELEHIFEVDSSDEISVEKSKSGFFKRLSKLGQKTKKEIYK